MTFFPNRDTIDLMILNSPDGTNTLSTVSRTRDHVNPIGLDTFRPSICIDTILDDMSLRSSLIIQNCRLLLFFARSYDAFSVFLIMESISLIVRAISLSSRLYCVVRESDINDCEGKLIIKSSGRDSS